MNYAELQKYCSYLYNNQLLEITKHNLGLAMEYNIPILNQFKNLTTDELLNFSINSIKTFLQSFIEGKALEEIKQSNKKWKEGLSEIQRNAVDSSDIALIHGIRKKSLLTFLPEYTTDIKLYHTISLQLDELYLNILDDSFRVFTEVQKELIRTEQELTETIINNSDEGIIALDLSNKVIIWNNTISERTGIKPDQIVGKNFYDFFPDYSNSEELKAIDLALKGEKVKIENGQYLRKKGFYEANVVPLRNDKKKIIGTVSIIADITERKLKEEELLKSEERNRLIINAIKDYSIFMLEPNGLVKTWNEGAKRIHGYNEEEIKGKHFSLFYPEKMQEEDFPAYELKMALQEGRFEDENWRIRKDGTNFWANVIITPIYNKENNLIGYSKITRDLTERKQFEDKLQEYNLNLENQVAESTVELNNTIEELRKINIDLDNFIYTASHDLKAPISNLEGLLSTMFDELEGIIKENKSLEMIMEMAETSVKRLKNTIIDLTEISKIQKGSHEDYEDVVIQETINEVKELTILSEDTAKIKIIVDTDSCTTIIFSKRNFNSIMYNLISNAIKYKSQDRDPEIKIRCRKNKEYAIIEVIDNGLGIAPHHLPKLFTMFKRFHDHVEGSGIGLYIVKRTIENAGGKIEVESELNKGSTFRLYFKINESKPDNKLSSKSSFVK